MSKPSPRLAATGMHNVRSEDTNKATPTTLFVPNLPARYPPGNCVSNMPYWMELKMMPWI
jgi:hypothetical protein